ncbi:MAG: sulfur carrier protein ThiS [Burkholderiaceae bacterium]|nr:sulfur carrier protein ThiS [Burkholderiaceae bacterium]
MESKSVNVDFTLNGEMCSLPKGSTLAKLIAELELSGQALTVKVNRRTVARNAWQQLLQPQDNVEIGLSLPGACVIDLPY